MRGSEDFGRFGQRGPTATFSLGAGENRPDLHNPDYDFPDELIAVGASVFMRTLRDLLGCPLAGHAQDAEFSLLPGWRVDAETGRTSGLFPTLPPAAPLAAQVRGPT
jgi:hypothetical protein